MPGSRTQRIVAKGGSRRRNRRPAEIRQGSDRCPSAREPREGASLALLTDILLGEHEWTMAQVRRLVLLAEQSELHALGRRPDDGGLLGR